MSRDPAGLAPEMRARWERSRDEYARTHPQGPHVFLTQTTRTDAEQDAYYAQGRTRPGKVVTNARAGQSLHNYGLAFDVAFKNDKGEIDWNDTKPYAVFAVIAKRNGLAWGGDWEHEDLPHFEPPGFTWHDAKAGKHPTYPALAAVGTTTVTPPPSVKRCECCGQVLA